MQLVSKALFGICLHTLSAGRKVFSATNKTRYFLVFFPIATVHDLEVFEVGLEVKVLAKYLIILCKKT